MTADTAGKTIFAERSFGRGRRLSLVAFLLGLGSVVLCVSVVVVSLYESRQIAEENYLQITWNDVRMLATEVERGKNTKTDQLLNLLSYRWINSGHWTVAPDEHFVIVDNLDSEVVFDTVYRGAGQRPPLSKAIREVIRDVREQQGLRSLAPGAWYRGTIRSEPGVELLGSFVKVSDSKGSDSGEPPGRNWLIGVYRSKAGLHAADGKFSAFRTLILVCGFGMPVSLLLMYYTYRLAQRDQLRAEEARTRLAAIVQDSEDAIYSESFAGTITSWNRGAERLFGYSETEAVGRSSAELIPAQHAADERQIVAQVGRGEHTDERTYETIRVRKDGSPVHVSQTISPITDFQGRRVGVSIIAQDITTRKNLEREVLESTSREQQRIGRELHDSLGQELTGLSYLAKSLSQKLAAAGNPHEETAQTIATGIQRAVREVRSAVAGLVPVEVDAAGFMVALEKLAAETETRCGIDCRVEGPEAVQIDDNVLATHLYRIVQEAINNAVKHAQARRIVVRPETENGTLIVTVQDDGVGIAEPARRNGGTGLRSMQYRAGVIDATLDVRTSGSGGTAVVCRVRNNGTKTEP